MNPFIRNIAIAAATGLTTGVALADDMPDKGNFKFPSGVTAKDLNDQDDERSVLAAAANAALTNEGFDDLIERLSSADRKRIGDFAEQKFADLDGRIDQIRKAWQSKYGEELDIDEGKLLDGYVVLREGEVTDPSAAAAAWPVAQSGMMETKQTANTPDTVGYLEKGRNVAIARFPGGEKAMAVNVSLIHESVDDWRIDVPDTVSGQQIKDNLLNCLTKIGEHTDQWPSDKREAARLIASKVAGAIYDVQMEAKTAG